MDQRCEVVVIRCTLAVLFHVDLVLARRQLAADVLEGVIAV